MSKINAYGHHQVGPTLFTERDWKARGDWDIDATIYEGWRLRSDGVLQSRMIRSRQADGQVVEHRGSSYRNVLRVNMDSETDPITIVRKFLARRNLRIVKES